jgi:hypothetical protein
MPQLMNYLEAVFKPSEDHYRELARQATYGHLAPNKHTTYKGQFAFIKSAYGDTLIVDSEFQGLPDSPWFMEAMLEYASDYLDAMGEDDTGLYLFSGIFRNYKFKGKITHTQLM